MNFNNLFDSIRSVNHASMPPKTTFYTTVFPVTQPQGGVLSNVSPRSRYHFRPHMPLHVFFFFYQATDSQDMTCRYWTRVIYHLCSSRWSRMFLAAMNANHFPTTDSRLNCLKIDIANLSPSLNTGSKLPCFQAVCTAPLSRGFPKLQARKLFPLLLLKKRGKVWSDCFLEFITLEMTHFLVIRSFRIFSSSFP